MYNMTQSYLLAISYKVEANAELVTNQRLADFNFNSSTLFITAVSNSLISFLFG